MPFETFENSRLLGCFSQLSGIQWSSNSGEKMQETCQVDQKASKSIEKVDRIRKSICQKYVCIKLYIYTLMQVWPCHFLGVRIHCSTLIQVHKPSTFSSSNTCIWLRPKKNNVPTSIDQSSNAWAHFSRYSIPPQKHKHVHQYLYICFCLLMTMTK